MISFPTLFNSIFAKHYMSADVAAEFSLLLLKMLSNYVRSVIANRDLLSNTIRQHFCETLYVS